MSIFAAIARDVRFDYEIKLRQRAATARNDLCVDVLSCEVAALHCDELIFRACVSDLSRCDHGLSIDVAISSTERPESSFEDGVETSQTDSSHIAFD